MNPYRIILADDHAPLRQSLRRIFEESGGMTVVGEAGDGQELIEVLHDTAADMVILDISMPRMQGVDALREIKRACSGVKTMMLTMHRDREYLYQALASGVDGYLLKEDADTELFSAVETIRQGRIYVSPCLAGEYEKYCDQAGRGEGPARPEGNGLFCRSGARSEKR